MKNICYILLAICLIGVGCERYEPTTDNDINGNDTILCTSLGDTEWKLVGIVDVETDTLIKELEPKECEECYTIAFDTDSTFSGRTTINLIMCGKYEFDYDTCMYRISGYIITEAGESGDGYLYCQIFVKNQYFTVKDTYPRTLHLHYNDGKNYLRYKKIGG